MAEETTIENPSEVQLPEMVQAQKEADFRAKLCAREIDRLLAEYKCRPTQQIIITPLPL